jgi:hypothetical protein
MGWGGELGTARRCRQTFHELDTVTPESSRMPSEQCAEESVRRDVQYIGLPSRQETQAELL